MSRADFEDTIMLQALEFDQSDDPLVRAKARGIRTMVPPLADFVMAEMQRKESPGITMAVMVEVFAVVLGSTIKLTMQGKTPAGIQSGTAALLALMIREMVPMDKSTVPMFEEIREIVRIAEMGDAEASERDFDEFVRTRKVQQ